MMIDNNDRLRQVQKFRSFRPLTGVHIHNNHGRIHIDNASCCLRCNKHITVILRIVHKMIDHRTYRCGNIIDDDKCLLVQASGRSVDTDCCAKTIQVTNLMTHNSHLFLAFNYLTQRMCFDTRTDTCRLLHLLRLAAIIRNLVFLLDNRLVTASSKSQINGMTSPVQRLRITGCINTQTNTQCYTHLIADINLSDFIQQCELGTLKHWQIFLTDDKHILVLLHLIHNGIIVLHILGDLSLYQCRQKGTSDFLCTVQCLFIVIYQYNTADELLILDLLPGHLYLCLIEQIKCK